MNEANRVVIRCKGCEAELASNQTFKFELGTRNCTPVAHYTVNSFSCKACGKIYLSDVSNDLLADVQKGRVASEYTSMVDAANSIVGNSQLNSTLGFKTFAVNLTKTCDGCGNVFSLGLNLEGGTDLMNTSQGPILLIFSVMCGDDKVSGCTKHHLLSSKIEPVLA